MTLIELYCRPSYRSLRRNLGEFKGVVMLKRIRSFLVPFFFFRPFQCRDNGEAYEPISTLLKCVGAKCVCVSRMRTAYLLYIPRQLGSCFEYSKQTLLKPSYLLLLYLIQIFLLDKYQQQFSGQIFAKQKMWLMTQK